MRNRVVISRIAPALVLLVLVATAWPSTAKDDGDTKAASNLLKTVTDRGRLSCGVNNAVPGFGFVDAQGAFSGFDIEFCRVVAAAVLGDATKVDFKPLTAEQRFTALQSSEVDVQIRNTTWTAKRDGAEGAAFATTTFYDGQGMMVRAGSNYRSLEDMQNTTICVLSGTTTELNLESQFRSLDITYKPLSFENNETLQQAFTRKRCQGWTSDKSQLAGVRSAFPASEGGPDALRILDVTMSKEPLGPVVRDGDQDWFDAVNWAVLATIQAEEFEITKANVDSVRTSSTSPEIQRFLGVTPSATSPSPGATTSPAAPTAFDPGLSLPVDFAYQVVKLVGNYEEIYNRTVGPSTPPGLARGVNALWTDGGLMYAPPYR